MWKNFTFKSFKNSASKLSKLKGHKQVKKDSASIEGVKKTTGLIGRISSTLLSILMSSHGLIVLAVLLGIIVVGIVASLIIALLSPKSALFSPNYQINAPFQNDQIVNNANSYVNYQAAMNHIQPDRLQWTLVSTAVVNQATLLFKIPPPVQRQIFNHLDQVALNNQNVRNLDLVSLLSANQPINNPTTNQALTFDDLINQNFPMATSVQKVVLKFAFIERYLMAQNIPNWAITNLVEKMIEPTMYVFSPFDYRQILNKAAIGGLLPSSSQPFGQVANKGHYQLQTIVANVLKNTTDPTGAALFTLKNSNQNYDWISLNQMVSPMVSFDFDQGAYSYLTFDQFINQMDHQGQIITMPATGIINNPLNFFNTLSQLIVTLVPDLPIFQVQIRADYFLKNEVIEQGFEWSDLDAINQNLGGGDKNADANIDIRSPWGADGSFNVGSLYDSKGQRGLLEKWSQVNNYQLFFNTTLANLQHRFNNPISIWDSVLRPADYNFFLTNDQGELLKADQNINGWKNLYQFDQTNDQRINRRFQYVYKDVSFNWLKTNFNPLTMALNQPLNNFTNLASQTINDLKSYFQNVNPDSFINSINLAAAFDLKATNDIIDPRQAISQPIPFYNEKSPGISNQDQWNRFQSKLDDQALSFNERYLPKYRYLDDRNQPNYLSDSSWSATNLAMIDRHTLDYLTKGKMTTNSYKWSDDFNENTIKNLNFKFKNDFELQLNPIANVANGLMAKQLGDLPANRLFVLPPKQSVKLINNEPYLYRDEDWNQQYDLDRQHQVNSGGWNMTTQAPMLSSTLIPQRSNIRFNIPTGIYFEQQFIHPDQNQIDWNKIIQRVLPGANANQVYYQSLYNDKNGDIYSNNNRTKALLKAGPLQIFNPNEQTTISQAARIFKASSTTDQPVATAITRQQLGNIMMPQFSRYLNLNLTLSPQLFNFKNNQAQFSLAKLLINVVSPLIQDLIINSNQFLKLDRLPNDLTNLFAISNQFAFTIIDPAQLNTHLDTFKKIINLVKSHWIYQNLDQSNFEKIAFKIAQNWKDVINHNLALKLADNHQSWTLNKANWLTTQRFNQFGIQTDFDQLLRFYPLHWRKNPSESNQDNQSLYQIINGGDANSVRSQFLKQTPAANLSDWNRLLNNISQNIYLERLMLNQQWDELNRGLFGMSAPLTGYRLNINSLPNVSIGDPFVEYGPAMINQFPKYLFSNFVGIGGLNPFGSQAYYLGLNSNFLGISDAGWDSNIFNDIDIITTVDPWNFGSIWSKQTFDDDALWISKNNAKWAPTRKDFIDSWWATSQPFSKATTSFPLQDLKVNPWLNEVNPFSANSSPYQIQIINISPQMSAKTNFYQTNQGDRVFANPWSDLTNLGSLDPLFNLNATALITSEIQRLNDPNLWAGDWQLNTFSPQQAWLTNVLQGWDAKVLLSRGFITSAASFDWDHQSISNLKMTQAMLFSQPSASNQPYDLQLNYDQSQLWLQQLLLALQNVLQVSPQILNDPQQFSGLAIFENDFNNRPFSPIPAKPALVANNQPFVDLDFNQVAIDLNNYWSLLVGNDQNDPQYPNRINGVALNVVSELSYRLIELNKLWADLNSQKEINLTTIFKQLDLGGISLQNDLIKTKSTLLNVQQTDLAYQPLIYLKNRIINWLYYLNQMPFANSVSLQTMIENNFNHHAFIYRDQISNAFKNLNQLYQNLIFANYDQILNNEQNQTLSASDFINLIASQIQTVARQLIQAHDPQAPARVVDPSEIFQLKTTITSLANWTQTLDHPLINNLINWWNLNLKDLPISPFISDQIVNQFLQQSQPAAIRVLMNSLIQLQNWLKIPFDGKNDVTITNLISFGNQFQENLSLIGAIYGTESRFDQIIHFEPKVSS